MLYGYFVNAIIIVTVDIKSWMVYAYVIIYIKLDFIH